VSSELLSFAEACQALDNYLSNTNLWSKEVVKLFKRLKDSILDGLHEDAIRLSKAIPPFPDFEETEEFKSISDHEKLIFRKYEEIKLAKNNLGSKKTLSNDFLNLSEWLGMELYLYQDDFDDYFLMSPFDYDEDRYDDFYEDLQLYGDEWEHWENLHTPKVDKSKILDLRRYFNELILSNFHAVQPNKREREGLSLILQRQELISRDEVKFLLDSYCSFREVILIAKKREELEKLKYQWELIVSKAEEMYERKRKQYRNGFGWLEYLGVPASLHDLYINSIQIYKERASLISQYEEKIKKMNRSPVRTSSKEGIGILTLNWKLLEEYDRQSMLLGIEKYYSRLEIEEIDWERLERLLDIIDCDQIYQGSNSFSGYICFYLRNQDFVILEKPIYGNATYLLPKESWEKFSKMTRTELLNRPQVKRCIHCSTWTECIKNGL